MADMLATERLLESIAMRAEFVQVHAGSLDADAEREEAAKILEAITELRRRGDTLVRGDDLRLVSAAANHGRQFGPSGDTDYTGFEVALARIESALGGTL